VIHTRAIQRSFLRAVFDVTDALNATDIYSRMNDSRSTPLPVGTSPMLRNPFWTMALISRFAFGASGVAGAGGSLSPLSRFFAFRCLTVLGKSEG
jgi:hypothetical protein